MLITTSPAPAQTAPPAPVHPQRDAILRVAARSLPLRDVNWRTATLSELACALRTARATWHFDIETAYEIDAWLAHYRGGL